MKSTIFLTFIYILCLDFVVSIPQSKGYRDSPYQANTNENDRFFERYQSERHDKNHNVAASSPQIVHKNPSGFYLRPYQQYRYPPTAYNESPFQEQQLRQNPVGLNEGHHVRSANVPSVIDKPRKTFIDYRMYRPNPFAEENIEGFKNVDHHTLPKNYYKRNPQHYQKLVSNPRQPLPSTYPIPQYPASRDLGYTNFQHSRIPERNPNEPKPSRELIRSVPFLFASRIPQENNFAQSSQPIKDLNNTNSPNANATTLSPENQSFSNYNTSNTKTLDTYGGSFLVDGVPFKETNVDHEHVSKSSESTVSSPILLNVVPDGVFLDNVLENASLNSTENSNSTIDTGLISEGSDFREDLSKVNFDNVTTQATKNDKNTTESEHIKSNRFAEDYDKQNSNTDDSNQDKTEHKEEETNKNKQIPNSNKTNELNLLTDNKVKSYHDSETTEQSVTYDFNNDVKEVNNTNEVLTTTTATSLANILNNRKYSQTDDKQIITFIIAAYFVDQYNNASLKETIQSQASDTNSDNFDKDAETTKTSTSTRCSDTMDYEDIVDDENESSAVENTTTSDNIDGLGIDGFVVIFKTKSVQNAVHPNTTNPLPTTEESFENDE